MSAFNYIKRIFSDGDEKDYSGVVVPLAQGRRYSKDIKADDAAGSIRDNASSSSSTTKVATTIEDLRAEVENDLATEGHDTTYDRMLRFCVL